MAHQHLNDPKYWQDRAEEIRIQAEQMNSEEARQMMFRNAKDYDELAERAAIRCLNDDHQ